MVAVARELTKRHEEVLVGTPAELAARLASPRGEFTLVVSGLRAADGAGAAVDVAALIEAGRRESLSDRSLVGLLRAAGVGRRDAYRAVEAHRSE
jgi:16S rRNA (cytidine1402-2'-O)-methyltransferase